MVPPIQDILKIISTLVKEKKYMQMDLLKLEYINIIV